MNLSSDLPSIAKARLPATYEAAKTALSECARIDECKTWQKKAEAMASYAKQADDDSLFRMATQIKGRAIKRCGELLQEFKRPADEGRPKKGGGATPLSARAAARDAGLSRDQTKTALRVANIPDAEFESLIESDRPPTITELADLGKKAKSKPLIDLDGRDPKEFALSTTVQGGLREFAESICRHDVASVVRGAFPRERKRMAAHAEMATAWLKDLVRAMERDL